MIGDHLTHQVAIMRRSEVGEDEYGQPVYTDTPLATVAAAIQPKEEREADTVSQTGAGITDHTIFMLPTDITGADYLLHDQGDCPLTSDLPHMRFEIEGIRNAAGIGHHLEITVRAVGQTADVTGS